MSDGALAVHARGLSKRYGSRLAVAGIDLSITRGECFGFLGPNGAGKTTTMRMLSCLTARDAGELLVLGHDPEREPRAVKRRLGVVAQQTTLDLELSVRENLVVWARYFDITGQEARRRADRMLEVMALTDRADEEVDGLSGGMQRRLQIGRAVINDPELVLLDEPTTGLDPQARHAVWERLRDLRAAGATLVLTTHYMDEAAQLCDRLVVIDHGRIVREGTPRGLVADEVGREVVELRVEARWAPPRLEAGGDLVRAHPQHGDLLVVYCDDAAALERALAATEVAFHRQTARAAGLEDVFLRLTGRGLRD
ncbi:MAG TPA: ABC transporter ATP-binding protein [Miltoncostaeaceae bacterium]|nr:ABC transporter ATP-binding protein [Miltoncostaeaceae bacterium]